MYKVHDFCILSGSRGRWNGGDVIFLLYIRVNMWGGRGGTTKTNKVKVKVYFQYSQFLKLSSTKKQRKRDKNFHRYEPTQLDHKVLTVLNDFVNFVDHETMTRSSL